MTISIILIMHWSSMSDDLIKYSSQHMPASKYTDHCCCIISRWRQDYGPRQFVPSMWKGSKVHVMLNAWSVTCSDRSVTCSDRSVTCSDRSVTCSDRLVTCSDRSVTCSDRSVTCSDRSVTCSDRSVTCSERSVTCSDRLVTRSDRSVTCSDRSVTCSDRSVTCSDQSVTCSDRSVTCSDQSVASLRDTRCTCTWHLMRPFQYKVFAGWILRWNTHEPGTYRSSIPTRRFLGYCAKGSCGHMASAWIFRNMAIRK